MNRYGLLSILLGCALPGLAAAEVPAGHFTLRSDPWVNLHHFLYHEARNTLRRDERLRGRVRTYRADRQVELGDDVTAWREALSIYAGYGDRHLFFDDGLLAIGNTLIGGPETFPTGPDAEPAFRALRLAMPVYRAHWWPRHDATNRTRIEELAGYLETYGAALSARIAEGYGVAWPEDPVVVDVTNYSGRHGAYATGDPNHIVLASGQDWYPGLLVLDVLFHEVGHTLPFEDQVLPRSRAAAEAAGVAEGDAWHAFLFYVPAQAVKGILPASHTPYAYFEDGPLVEGPMARAEPYIRAALAQSDDLDEVFRLVHSARAADAD